MATDASSKKSTLQVFDVDMIPCPPGTKSRSRLPRGLDSDPLPARAWWYLGATAVAMLIVGALIGRLVLP